MDRIIVIRETRVEGVRWGAAWQGAALGRRPAMR
jgi:hypothetical protein